MRDGMPPGYDEWKLRSPEDDEAMRYPWRKRGLYTIKVTRQIEATIEVEIEATSEDDALDYAVIEARKIPLHQWETGQDDFDATTIDSPPERDPDAEREDRYDD